MRRHLAALLVLALTVGLAACDSAEEGTATLLAPLPDLDAAIGTDPPTLDLSAYIRTTGTVTLTATSLDGRVQPSLSGQTLRLVPIAEGTGRVRVEAQTPEGVAVSHTFGVRVVGPCPAPAPEGLADLFPLSRTWQRSYTVAEVRRPAPGTDEERTFGTASVAVLSATLCEDDTQTYHIRERTTLTTQRRAAGDTAWVHVSGPVTEERTVRWTVTDSTVSTDAPDLPGRRDAGLAPPPFGREVPRFVSRSLFSPGSSSIQIGRDLPYGPAVGLTEGVGPVWYSTTTLFGTAGDATLTWQVSRGDV